MIKTMKNIFIIFLSVLIVLQIPFTITANTQLNNEIFTSSAKSNFEFEDVLVYTSLDLSVEAQNDTQDDAGASNGKVSAFTDGKYFLFENVSEANRIKLSYASTATNTISVWIRYPDETELVAMPAISFSTSNSWSMSSSASYIATSAVFYIPKGSDIILRPNVACNLDKLWLSYENNVSQNSAPSNTITANKLDPKAKTDLMAPYRKAALITKGQSLTFEAPDAQQTYNAVAISYCSEGALLELTVNGESVQFDAKATSMRNFEVVSASIATYKHGDSLTLTCKQGEISIGYIAVNYVPDVSCAQVSTMPNKGERLTVDLNGVWAFDSTSFAQWSVDNYVPDLDFINAIPVPGLWSSAFMKMGDNQWHKAWYKKNVVLEEEPNCNVMLYIEQAQYGRYVYVNGNLIDTYEYNYSASYSDLTGLLHKGENEIIVMLGDFTEQFSNPDCNAHLLHDGESRYDLPGITGSVELVFNSDPTVSKVQTNPDIENGTLDVQLVLNAHSAITTDVKVTVYELGVFKNGKPTTPETKVAEYIKKDVNVAKGENDPFLIEDISLENWTREKCWTPDNPFLYRVEVSTVGDVYSFRIGMRTFGYDSKTKYYTLNGELLYLRGTNVAIERYYDDPLCGTTPWQEDWVRKLYNEYKQVNWFCFRAHLGNANELWFDLADEMGFLIIDEYPQWGDMDGCTENTNMPEIYRWIDLRANHPSLFMFDAQNEAIGTGYTDEICRLGREYDLQNRTWDNGWRPPVFDDSPVECHPYFLDGKGVGGITEDKYTKPLITTAYIGWQAENVLDHPFILNEHGEIWVGRSGIPMSGTAGNWNVHLRGSSSEERLTYYADVMAAQMEAFRAGRGYSGLLFFCGLGSDFPDHVGITCDILSPDVSTAESLEIRPYIKELLSNAFADLGIVTQYYSENVKRGEPISVPVKLINDTGKDINDLTVILTVQSGNTVLYADRTTMNVSAFSQENDGLASHAFKLNVPSFDKYCDNGDELYLISSYTLDGETVYSRRKLIVRGGDDKTDDPLPEYDWLPDNNESSDPENNSEDNSSEGSISDADVSETPSNISAGEEEQHKPGSKLVIIFIVLFAVSCVSVGILIYKKKSNAKT